MAVTRLGLDGYGVRRAGSFVGKTAAPVVVTVTPEYQQFGIALPYESAGPAPQFGKFNPGVDRDFEALARVAEIGEWLQDVGEVYGVEVVDVMENPLEEDADLLFGEVDVRPRRRRR